MRIFSPPLNTPNTYEDDKTLDDIRALKILNAKFIRTPILAAYRKWGMNSDYQKLVSFLVKFFFKFRTIIKTHPGGVEKIILDTTKLILDGTSVSEIINKIKEDDDHKNFNYNFVRFMEEVKNDDTAKYILQQITLYLGDNATDVRPIDYLTLEHILPQKFNEHWNSERFL